MPVNDYTYLNSSYVDYSVDYESFEDASYKDYSYDSSEYENTNIEDSSKKRLLLFFILL